MSAAQLAFAEKLANKLPTFDPTWPDEWRAAWIGWVEQIMEMGRGSRGSVMIFVGTSLWPDFTAAALPRSTLDAPP